jgi:hypothetical protein
MVEKKKNDIDLFFIDDPIYKFKINLLYGGTYDSFLDTVEDGTGIKSERPNGRTLGCFWSAPKRDLYFLWLPRRFKVSTLGHEIIHLLYAMFNIVGVPTHIDNQETFSYHWEWWFDKIRTCTSQVK